MKSSLTKLWSGLEQILYFIIVKVLHLSVLDKNWEGFMQFVKFGIIGLSNTCLLYTSPSPRDS